MPVVDASNVFIENQAVYGANIASFPIRLNLIVKSSKNITISEFQTRYLNESIFILNISSGYKIPYNFVVQLLDVYDNLVQIEEGF